MAGAVLGLFDQAAVEQALKPAMMTVPGAQLYVVSCAGNDDSSYFHGKVEDGRYFVVSAGHRYTEVSEARWRIEQHLECCFPWLPVVLIWMGLAFRDGPGVPPKLTAFLGIAGVVGTASVVVAGWVITGDPIYLRQRITLALIHG